MSEIPEDVLRAARELFVDDSGLVGNPAAEHAIAGVRAGDYDDYPMLRFACRAILAERERCAAIADKYAKDAFAVCEGDAAAAGREIAVAIRTPATSA